MQEISGRNNNYPNLWEQQGPLTSFDSPRGILRMPPFVAVSHDMVEEGFNKILVSTNLVNSTQTGCWQIRPQLHFIYILYFFMVKSSIIITVPEYTPLEIAMRLPMGFMQSVSFLAYQIRNFILVL